MKTSLNIEDEVFNAAKKEAANTDKSISEVISYWARIGRDALKEQKGKPKDFKPVELGGEAALDLTKRRDWLEELDK